jgi:hypothetical protein
VKGLTAIGRKRDDIVCAGSPLHAEPPRLFAEGRLRRGALAFSTRLDHDVTFSCELVVPETGARGVIITQGGSAGGWSLYAHEGRLNYCYNFFGINYYIVAADEPIGSGEHQVRMEFHYDSGGLAKGGDVTLYYDGRPVGKGRVD